MQWILSSCTKLHKRILILIYFSWNRYGIKLQHKDEVHDLYHSPNIISVMKSRRMKSARYVAHTGKKVNACTVLVRKPEGKSPLWRSQHRWETKIHIKGEDGRAWIGFICLRPGTKDGLCEHSNELSSSIKCDKHLDSWELSASSSY